MRKREKIKVQKANSAGEAWHTCNTCNVVGACVDFIFN